MSLAINLLGQRVTVAELLGNACALTTVWLAQRRTMWCWPVQLAGQALLFVVFIRAHLAGNAARQGVFAMLAVYGWLRWRHQVRIRRLTWPGRAATGLGLGGLTAVCI